jgi:hypothetical protein
MQDCEGCGAHYLQNCSWWCGLSKEEIDAHEKKEQGAYYLAKENMRLKKAVDILMESNSFYANKDNWKKSHQVMRCLTHPSDRDRVNHQNVVGGKKARQAEALVKEILGE